MAGHSKWANIKRHKAKQDAKRGKLYTKLIREISVSAKLGGAEANTNPRLRAALDKALQANMTKDVIERAIKRGVGGVEDQDLEEIRYEGYAPGGVAVIVQSLTNNRNRTVGEVRHLFSKFGGNLGTDGSVAYLFKKQGQLTFAPPVDEERLMELALECGAEDVIVNPDQSIDVLTMPECFMLTKESLAKVGFHAAQAEISLHASTRVVITELEMAEAVIQLIDALEDLDDVQEVYSNADISDDILNALS